MGPRAFTRGDARIRGMPPTNFFGLQWGHAHSRVETDDVDRSEAELRSLQWGHAHSRVET